MVIRSLNAASDGKGGEAEAVNFLHYLHSKWGKLYSFQSDVLVCVYGSVCIHLQVNSCWQIIIIIVLYLISKVISTKYTCKMQMYSNDETVTALSSGAPYGCT